MTKRAKFPVAKYRRDGTPAIWLTATNWSVLADGIIRKYLEVRESFGRARARDEARAKLPATWKDNPRLKTWALLDSTRALCGATQPEEVLELYRIGLATYRTEFGEDRLLRIGAAQEENGYKTELEEIERAAGKILEAA